MTQFEEKQPPCAIDIEGQIIGTILTYPDSLNDIISILTPDMFYDSKLQKVFKICLEIYKKFGKLDVFTVSSELKKITNQDENIFLIELTQSIITNQMIMIHATIVKQAWMQRYLLTLANEIKDSVYNDDLADTLEKAETGLLNLSGKLHTKEPKLLGLIINDVIDTIDKINKNEIQLFGIPSGFTALDRITSGFNKGELIMIAGRPSVGKTAIALQIAKNSAEFNFPVGIFSCEMSQFQQGMRFLSGVSGYSNTQLRQKDRCNVAELIEKSEGLQKLGIYVDETSAISLLELRAKTRKLILKYGIKLIIIDYLQLMSGSTKKQNREQEVSEISAGLKAIAVDLDIPVIALSQLNRKSEERSDRRPRLSDLRDSGSLEQDSDLVLILHRPAVYGESTYTDCENKEKSADGLIVVEVAKHRNGAIGEIYLHHNVSMTQITDETI